MRTRSTGKRTKKPRGFVRVYTWTPKTRTERTVKTKRIALHSPEQIIRDAADVAGYIVRSVTVVGIWSTPSTPSTPDPDPEVAPIFDLRLYFGVSDGTEYRATVTLSGKEDCEQIEAHLRRTQSDVFETRYVSLLANYSEDSAADDDGGEELPVPTVSESDLAAMEPITTGVM